VLAELETEHRHNVAVREGVQFRKRGLESVAAAHAHAVIVLADLSLGRDAADEKTAEPQGVILSWWNLSSFPILEAPG